MFQHLWWSSWQKILMIIWNQGPLLLLLVLRFYQWGGPVSSNSNIETNEMLSFIILTQAEQFPCYFFKVKENIWVIWICSLYHLIFFLDPNLLKLLEFRINILISYWTRSKSTSFSTSQCISRMVGFLNSTWVCTSSKIYRFMIFVWMNSYMKLRWR